MSQWDLLLLLEQCAETSANKGHLLLRNLHGLDDHRKHSKAGAFILHLQVAQTPKNLTFLKLLLEEQSSF